MSAERETFSFLPYLLSFHKSTFTFEQKDHLLTQMLCLVTHDQDVLLSSFFYSSSKTDSPNSYSQEKENKAPNTLSFHSMTCMTLRSLMSPKLNVFFDFCYKRQMLEETKKKGDRKLKIENQPSSPLKLFWHFGKTLEKLIQRISPWTWTSLKRIHEASRSVVVYRPFLSRKIFIRQTSIFVCHSSAVENQNQQSKIESIHHRCWKLQEKVIQKLATKKEFFVLYFLLYNLFYSEEIKLIVRIERTQQKQ